MEGRKLFRAYEGTSAHERSQHLSALGRLGAVVVIEVDIGLLHVIPAAPSHLPLWPYDSRAAIMSAGPLKDIVWHSVSDVYALDYWVLPPFS